MKTLGKNTVVAALFLSAALLSSSDVYAGLKKRSADAGEDRSNCNSCCKPACKPACPQRNYLHASNQSTFITLDGQQDILLNVVNVQNGWTTVDNINFVCPAAGVYRVSYTVQVSATQTGTAQPIEGIVALLSTAVAVNGALLARSEATQNLFSFLFDIPTWDTISHAFLVNLNQGDVVKLVAAALPAGNTTVNVERNPTALTGSPQTPAATLAISRVSC